jgi:hypothetical protein
MDNSEPCHIRCDSYLEFEVDILRIEEKKYSTRAISNHMCRPNGQFHVGTNFVTDGQTDGQCTTRRGTDHSCKVWIKIAPVVYEE